LNPVEWFTNSLIARPEFTSQPTVPHVFKFETGLGLMREAEDFHRRQSYHDKRQAWTENQRFAKVGWIRRHISGTAHRCCRSTSRHKITRDKTAFCSNNRDHNTCPSLAHTSMYWTRSCHTRNSGRNCVSCQVWKETIQHEILPSLHSTFYSKLTTRGRSEDHQ
jgi:hypothetical protein